MTCTAIITARGGSKGLPGKNIRHLNGKPLILHTVDAALNSGAFSRIIVSSDSEEILSICQKPDIETIERPEELATDTASSLDVIDHVVKKAKIEGSCCLLQPTSPLRTADHIRDAWKIFESSKCSSLVSVVTPDEPPQKALILNPESGNIEPLINKASLTAPRQILPRTFFPNGAIYFFNAQNFGESKDLFSAPLSVYEMTKADSLDIDTLQDFKQAEEILSLQAGKE